MSEIMLHQWGFVKFNIKIPTFPYVLLAFGINVGL